MQAAAARLARGHRALARRYPGETGARQPVHVVYGGAHLFHADTCGKLGERALETLDAFAPNFAVFARALGLPKAERLPEKSAEVSRLARRLAAFPAAPPGERAAWLAHAVYARVREKLAREPVEDFRIDFEDGYGLRSNEEEDGHAVAVGEELARARAAASLPLFVGIRLKSLSEELRERSLRTLDLVLTALAARTRGRLPRNFIVTLPKVRVREEVETLAGTLDRLEHALGLAAGAVKLELMVETAQSLLDASGAVPLLNLVAAARGRCIGAHFGTYDFTAACNITPAFQTMTHPACDFARRIMQVALAGTGVWLSDGATNVLPIPPHEHRSSSGGLEDPPNGRRRRGSRKLERREPQEAGPALSPREMRENREAVHRAWKLHYDDVRNSLANGFYEGWDLHPAQLPTRYAANYAFFLESLDAAAERLRNFVGKAGQATLVGTVFDDAATGQALLNFLLRAVNCGAVSTAEALARTGLEEEELALGSFLAIIDRRAKKESRAR
jgi:citrate lyase beta subunit